MPNIFFFKCRTGDKISLSLSLLTYIEIKSLRIAISSDIYPWCRPRADRCIYNQVNFKTRGLASSLPHNVSSNSRLLAVPFWNRIYFPYPLCILSRYIYPSVEMCVPLEKINIKDSHASSFSLFLFFFFLFPVAYLIIYLNILFNLQFYKAILYFIFKENIFLLLLIIILSFYCIQSQNRTFNRILSLNE